MHTEAYYPPSHAEIVAERAERQAQAQDARVSIHTPGQYESTMDAIAILAQAQRGPAVPYVIVAHATARLESEIREYLRG